MQPQNSHHPPREWELRKISEQGREAVSSNFSEDAAGRQWRWSGCWEAGACSQGVLISISCPCRVLVTVTGCPCDSRTILCGLCLPWLQIAPVSFQELHRLLQRPLSLVNEELRASSVSPHAAQKCSRGWGWGWEASRVAGLVLLDARNLAGCNGLSQEI